MVGFEPLSKLTNQEIIGAPGQIRTADLNARSVLLYPAELQAQKKVEEAARFKLACRIAATICFRDSAIKSGSGTLPFFGGGKEIRTLVPYRYDHRLSKTRP